MGRNRSQRLGREDLKLGLKPQQSEGQVVVKARDVDGYFMTLKDF